MAKDPVDGWEREAEREAQAPAEQEARDGHAAGPRRPRSELTPEGDERVAVFDALYPVRIISDYLPGTWQLFVWFPMFFGFMVVVMGEVAVERTYAPSR